MMPISLVKVKVKVQCNLVQKLMFCTGLTAHRGSRGIALLFLGHGSRRGEWSASHPGRSLGQAHIETQAGATQGRPGHGDAAREALRDTV